MTVTATALLAVLLVASDAGPSDEEMIVTPGPISIAELQAHDPRQLLRSYEIGELCERSAAYWHLCRLGERARPLVPQLVGMLDDPEMRRRATWLLGSLGPVAEDAIEPVIAMIDAGEEGSEDLAILLGRMGPVAADAAPAIAMLLDDDPPRKGNVLRAFLSLDPPESIRMPVMISLLGDENSTVRRKAIVELGRLREHAAGAFEPLVDVMFRSPEDGRHASRALALITGLPFAYPGMPVTDDPLGWAMKEVARPWLSRNGRAAGFTSFDTWYDAAKRSYVVVPHVRGNPSDPDEEPAVDQVWVESLCRFLQTERFEVVPSGRVIVLPAPASDPRIHDPHWNEPPPRQWVTRCR
ncbi:MAG: HEAT repeat domain-containing protein [Planctomycetes bacterium]|nr:HEAT repeat domain-containing protein [Planctomycetota bacterium]